MLCCVCDTPFMSPVNQKQAIFSTNSSMVRVKTLATMFPNDRETENPEEVPCTLMDSKSAGCWTGIKGTVLGTPKEIKYLRPYKECLFLSSFTDL